MKKKFVSIDFAPVLPMPQTCSYGDVQLYQNITFISGERPFAFETISGTLRVCIDEQFVPVCSNNRTEIDIMNVIDRACEAIGYNG